ncbi:muramidase family protein [Orenia marismortui]|uniref:LysM domain-containing protein n=1 Tax=Orenia marismortui TaxID=46469 RepID=A0A4R8GG52_9FIRM|nr:LysM domain-containing protein [Orenia marismortui]TDX44492.1 LysM domain-containing protein [Orenia marismortui]
MANQSDNPNCPNGSIYTIRPGDTLYNLSRRFEITLDEILNANPDIDPNNLKTGQKICIPVEEISGKCPTGFLYTVVLGDTFFSIARRFNVSIDALTSANSGVNPNQLQIGQELCIPAATPPVRPCPGRFYTVQAGETFTSIAKKFGYTLDALLIANPGIESKELRAGQEICLPPAPGAGPVSCPGGSIYIVKPGETLFIISQKYGTPLNELIAANPQIEDPNQLEAGIPICIPS